MELASLEFVIDLVISLALVQSAVSDFLTELSRLLAASNINWINIFT